MSHKAKPHHAKNELNYPFGKRWSPEPGKPFKVADGVYWLRMPLPVALDHINLWLLEEDDGLWTIVDSGYDDQSCRDVWDYVFSNFCSAEDVKQIVITHFHPDHIGLAAWLGVKCKAPILMSKGEFDHYSEAITKETKTFVNMTRKFAIDVGFDDSVIDIYASFFGRSNKSNNRNVARVQKNQCKFIIEGDELIIRGRVWRVVVGSGHSPEHICLYCEKLKTFISGDQAISRISSNVSVYPLNPKANPLKGWLQSCEKLRDSIPEDTLILASHQEPFMGITRRMQSMLDEHYANLALLRKLLINKITIIDARKLIFNRELDLINLVLATGETLAYLNYLHANGELKMDQEKGVTYYQSIT